MEEKPVNPKTVKGIRTDKDPEDIRVDLGAKGKSEIAYHEPKNAEESLLQGLAGVGFGSPLDLGIKGGTNFSVNKLAGEIYTPIDLVKALPDPNERQALIDEHGSRMVKLMDPDEWGIRFNNEIADYATFKAKKYDVQLKKFMDELDENQGFISESLRIAGSLIGKTGVAVTGIIPLVYGLGKGLFTWDAQNVFNNSMFDAWESADKWFDKKLVVYGGASYYEGDKGFFARMIDNPMKSINTDVVPATAFILGAVGTELLAGMAAPFTGGISFELNTARLAAQATNVFGKSYKVLRGLDALSDMQNMRKIAELTQKYRQGLGTATSMIRSAGYESSLIARDTYNRTLEQSKLNYIQSNPILKQKADQLASYGMGEQDILKELEGEISSTQLAAMNKAAEASSELAWFSNVPLVGFSNLIQFSKVFNSSYKLGQQLAKLNPGRLTGTVLDKTGKAVARAETAGWGRKLVGYGTTLVKDGVTEGFEEYAQGVMERGYSDYYSAQFTNDAVQKSASFLTTMANASRKYVNTTEGQDSMTIGALMGMLGIGLPVTINEHTGKVSRGFSWQGGAYQEIKELKKKIEQDKANAKYRNENKFNPVLKNNFENMMKNITIQREMDEAIDKGDIFNYKNKEYEQLHSFVSNRYKNGIADTIHQDLDALEQLPLNVFNEQFAFKGFEFTEESRKKALDTARKNVNNIVKAHEHVDAMYNDSKLFVDFWRKNYKGLEDPFHLTEGLKEQMTFLYGSVLNLQKREDELTATIKEKSNGHINTSVGNDIYGTTTNIKDNGKVGLITNSKDVLNQQLTDWAEQDPVGYSLNVKQLTPLAQDLILIKQRKAQLAAMYDTLFTNKGAKKFVDIYQQLINNRNKAIAEEALKQTKETLKKAKSSDTVKAQSKNEQSLTGLNTTESEKVDEELAATDAVLKQLAEEHPDAGNVQDLSEIIPLLNTDKVIEQLQKSPALFQQILDKLEAEGNVIPGLNNIDQLDEVVAENPDNLAKILNAFEAIHKTFNEHQEVNTSEKLSFADPKDEEQPNPNVEEATTLSSKYATKTQEQIENSIFQGGSNVTNNSVIPVLHDKKINNNSLVRNPQTGKWEVWTDNKGKPTDQPVDTKTINSSDFLNNKELKENERLATFKLSENEWNKTERSIEDIAIDIYHGDTFIGRLPAYKQGMPVHLLALRKSIVEQQLSEEINNETTSDIEAKKADIEKDQQGNFVPKKYTLNLMGENPAPNIPLSAISEESFGGELPTAVKQVKLLEIRGKNSLGQTVGEIWVQKEDGQSYTADVIFNDAELAALGQTQNNTEIIDKNFDTIIEQLIKAKVNVFFNDKNQFKKCD